MKQRLISALVALLLLAVVLLLVDTLVLNAVICLIGVVAVIELLNATKCIRFKGLTATAVVMAVVISFARAGYVALWLPSILFFVVLIYFLLLLKNHETMRVEHVAMAFFFSVFVPLFYSCAVFIRDDFGAQVGLFYILLACGSAWLTDSAAYFTGLRFGKHKMAPHISPKKTWEGAVGGLVLGTGCMLLLALGFQALMEAVGFEISIRYGMVALFSPVFSVIGMLGDLSASVIKRHFGVKDYGNIMPGHGGVLDRCDSLLFTLPAVYIVVRHVTIATLL